MKIFHKRVGFDYEIIDKLEAGIQLTGAEVKSLLLGHASLEGSFVRVIGFEMYLVNAQIFPYIYARPEGFEPRRTRKLLLHKKEILKLKTKIEGNNLTIVPVLWYNKGPKIKLEIALARGKKEFEKREKKKREDMKRELERDFRGKIK
jgi:SsrA-binding protein